MTTVDLILVEGTGIYSRAIRLAQRMTGFGPDAGVTHVAIKVTDDDSSAVIEAKSNGVTLTAWPAWVRTADPHQIVPVAAEPLDATEMADYVVTCANRHNRYDWLTIVSIGLHLVTGGLISISLDDHNICSGLAANMLTRRGDLFDNANTVMPAEIARRYARGNA